MRYLVWYGNHTGRWWAMVHRDGRWLLLEAATPDVLAQLIKA
jgi:hypothetical protein